MTWLTKLGSPGSVIGGGIVGLGNGLAGNACWAVVAVVVGAVCAATLTAVDRVTAAHFVEVLAKSYPDGVAAAAVTHAVFAGTAEGTKPQQR